MQDRSSPETSLREQYLRHAERFEELAKYAKHTMEALCEANGIKGAIVSYRIKDREGSVKKAMRRRYQEITQLVDLCGTRIVTRSLSSCEAIAWVLKSNFEVDVENSEDKAEEASATQFGYRSIHLVLSLGPDRLALSEAAGFSRMRFEVQIRTILQHGWAEATHAAYKLDSGNSLPENSRRGFASAAMLIESADDMLDLLDLRQSHASTAASLRAESMAESLPDLTFVLSVEHMELIRSNLLDSQQSDIDLAMLFGTTVANVPLNRTGNSEMPVFLTVDEVPSLKRRMSVMLGVNGYVFPGILRALAHLDKVPYTIRIKRARVSCNALRPGSQIQLNFTAMQRLNGSNNWGRPERTFSETQICGISQSSVDFLWDIPETVIDSPFSVFRERLPTGHELAQRGFTSTAPVTLTIKEKIPFGFRTRRQETGKDLLPARCGTIILTRVRCEEAMNIVFYLPKTVAAEGIRFELVEADLSGGPERRPSANVAMIGDRPYVKKGNHDFHFAYECVFREATGPIELRIEILLSRGAGAGGEAMAGRSSIGFATSLGPVSTVTITDYNLIPRFADTSKQQTFAWTEEVV